MLHSPPALSSRRHLTAQSTDALCLQDLSLSRTIATGNSWVTAVRFMPVFKALAVTTFARSVTLYDITSPFCSICGAIPKMDFTPMSMDILPCRGEPKSELVVIGDSGGLVHVHKLVPRANGETFQVRSGRRLEAMPIARVVHLAAAVADSFHAVVPAKTMRPHAGRRRGGSVRGQAQGNR